MIGVELVQVAILWCIAGLSSICAINARGLLRQLISWTIVVAIIGAALFFSYMKVENVKQEFGLTFPAAPTEDSIAANSSSGIADAENDTYSVAEKQMIESVLAIADSIIAFPEWRAIQAQGIERREGFESKARFLRNRSMDSYRQIRNLTPSPEKKLSYDVLLATADNLRLAGYEVHNQFGLDADASGESIAKARERANQVKSAILTIISKE